MVRRQKFLNPNRTQAFYLRRYASLLLSCILTVVIVLMVELCAFISPTKLQVSVDHNLIYPALQPEITVWPPGRKQRPHIQSLWALLRDLTTSFVRKFHFLMQVSLEALNKVSFCKAKLSMPS